MNNVYDDYYKARHASNRNEAQCFINNTLRPIARTEHAEIKRLEDAKRLTVGRNWFQAVRINGRLNEAKRSLKFTEEMIARLERMFSLKGAI